MVGSYDHSFAHLLVHFFFQPTPLPPPPNLLKQPASVLLYQSVYGEREKDSSGSASPYAEEKHYPPSANVLNPSFFFLLLVSLPFTRMYVCYCKNVTSNLITFLFIFLCLFSRLLPPFEFFLLLLLFFFFSISLSFFFYCSAEEAHTLAYCMKCTTNRKATCAIRIFVSHR